MIFSFSNKLEKEIQIHSDQTDVYCFFHSNKTVSLPQTLWLQAIATSLKMKKNVLVLEESFITLPEIDTSRRWQVGTGFLWLAPRALSVLLEAYNTNPSSYDKLKETLSVTK